MNNHILLKNKNAVTLRNHNSKKQTSSAIIQQTSAYLKQQIGEIIKTELKTFYLRNKLHAEVQMYKKQQQNMILSRSLVADRMLDFRERQRNLRKRQLQVYQKKQSERDERLNSFVTIKKEVHKNKYMKLNQSIGMVQDKHINILNQDANIRLSKLNFFTSQGKRSQHCRHLEGRTLSQNSSRVNFVREMEGELEQQKITKYLDKIEKCQSRVLLREIQNNKRRESGIRKKFGIKNVQKQYNQRMKHHQLNLQQLSETKQLAMQNRSILNTKTFQQIKGRKEKIHNEEIKKIVNSYISKGGKQNMLKKYKSELDLHYTESNRIKNLLKMKINQDQTQLEQKIRLLKCKIQQVKNIKDGQKLDDRSISLILSMMDKKDQQYSKMVEFLNTERNIFIQAIVKKQEQNNKVKKLNMNKTQCKLNSL